MKDYQMDWVLSEFHQPLACLQNKLQTLGKYVELFLKKMWEKREVKKNGVLIVVKCIHYQGYIILVEFLKLVHYDDDDDY